MYNKFKNKEKVFVYGPGEKSGKFYRNVPAFIVERDPYYQDYLVRFKDGKEDWIQPQHLRKPYERKIKNKNIKNQRKRR